MVGYSFFGDRAILAHILWNWLRRSMIMSCLQFQEKAWSTLVVTLCARLVRMMESIEGG